MNIRGFVGKSVIFHVSDPWDFGEKNGCGPFIASVVDTTESDILIHLNKPFNYQGLTIDHMVVTTRHVGEVFGDLTQSIAISVNFTPVSDHVKLQEHEAVERGYTHGSPFHVAASWRGWGLTGDMRLA